MKKQGREFDKSKYREWIDPAEVKPYERNAKIHTEKQIDNICNSIRRFGWQQDVVLTADNVCVIGHGRRLAAIKLGCEMPFHRIDKTADALTDEDIRELRIADNQTNAETENDWEILQAELEGLTFDGFDFVFGEDEESWFDRKEKDGNAREDGNDEYNSFLDKFETKKTTDDCYTPELVYNAVADWVEKEYGVKRTKFIRPFYPGGDYQKEKYAADCVVVDNPPFSILSKIIRFYNKNNIKFFLFAPTLTLFTAIGEDVEYMPTGVDVTYENGAVVCTSFINNIGKNRIYVSATLYNAVDKANDENLAETRRTLPKYIYPDEAILAAKIYPIAQYGQTLKIPKAECVYQNRLDAQKDGGKDAFGGLFLISEKAAAEKAAAEKAAAEKAAAEKAAAEKWQLSDREREIVEALGKG